MPSTDGASSAADSASSELLARFTPDTETWRKRVAALSALAAPLALWGAYAVASGVKSGMMYNLAILFLGVLALVLPVLATVALFAPESGLSAPESDEEAVELLKRRYAADEIDQAEFERRLDELMAVEEAVAAGLLDGAESRDSRHGAETTRDATESDRDSTHAEVERES
jgi:uncharacterized membrane protein